MNKKIVPLFSFSKSFNGSQIFSISFQNVIMFSVFLVIGTWEGTGVMGNTEFTPSSMQVPSQFHPRFFPLFFL